MTLTSYLKNYSINNLRDGSVLIDGENEMTLFLFIENESIGDLYIYLLAFFVDDIGSFSSVL